MYTEIPAVLPRSPAAAGPALLTQALFFNLKEKASVLTLQIKGRRRLPQPSLRLACQTAPFMLRFVFLSSRKRLRKISETM